MTLQKKIQMSHTKKRQRLFQLYGKYAEQTKRLNNLFSWKQFYNQGIEKIDSFRSANKAEQDIYDKYHPEQERYKRSNKCQEQIDILKEQIELTKAQIHELKES